MANNATKRDLLRTYLTHNGVDVENISFTLETFEPFFQRAESGTYTLSPASELEEDEVAAAIANALGKEVTRVIFISRAHSWPKPGWMLQEVYDVVRHTHSWNSDYKNLGIPFWEELWDNLGGSLYTNLEYSLTETIGDILVEIFGRDKGKIWEYIRDSLFIFLGLQIARDQEFVERLTPLVKVLPHAVPLGEQKHQSGTWLVLVA